MNNVVNAIMNLKRFSFTDLNECQLNENLCAFGTCINTDGGFICQCPENYVLSPDGKKCVDVRQDLCYDSFLGG